MMPTIEIIPDWTQLMVQLFSLIVLFFVFKKFMWAPMTSFLQARQAHLNAGFEEVRVAQEQADKLKNTYESKLAGAEDEARQIVEENREEGRKIYDEMVTQARQEITERLERVAVAIEEDKLAAKKQMQTQMLDVATLGAQMLIKKEIDKDVHEQLFADFIAKVGGTDEAH